MRTRKDPAAARDLQTLFNLGAIRELTDGQLLERFSTGRGEPAELAFAALVERHGAMVLRVCRARLNDPHDAMDAFQATFLVLVTKARSLWVHDSLGPWLHQVALRTARCARASAARRRAVERRAAERTPVLEPPPDPPADDLEQVLHDEIDRLPERYRVPIILCDLEGHTCEEAARRLGRPVGTVKCWRSRGRDRLRDRLTRRGLAPEVNPVTSRRPVPDTDAAEVVSHAVRFRSDRTSGAAPTSVILLVKGVLSAMFLSKLRMTAAALALALLAAGLGAVACGAGDNAKGTVAPNPRNAKRPGSVTESLPMPDDFPRVLANSPWQLTLREAITFGLDSSRVVRILKRPPDRANGAPWVIAARDPGWERAALKADVMAQVRVIEQRYWGLAQQYVQLWASQKAVELSEEVVRHEKAKLDAGLGNTADLAEARQRLEQLRIDLATRTSDLVMSEKGFRNLIGLTLDDTRRIVPASAPVEAKLEPDWDDCQSAMLANQPDILQAFDRVKKAEGASDSQAPERLTRDFLKRLVGEATFPDPGTSRAPSKLALLEAVQKRGHALSRSFLEVDANYKQFQTAKRFRAAAVQRLEAQRASYDEGRITIDRYLDAVSQYANAVAQEAQFKTAYNNAIVALEEAKGTLLDHDQIVVATEPVAAGPDNAATPSARPAAVGPDIAALPTASPPPSRPQAPTPGPTPLASPARAADNAGQTYSFHFTIGFGPRPLEVRGAVTVAPAGPAGDLKSP